MVKSDDGFFGFSARLRAARAAKGWSQGKLAEMTKEMAINLRQGSISLNAVHRWENGLAFPNIIRVEELACQLDVSPGWLAFGSKK